MYYLSVNYIKWFQNKNINFGIFLIWGFISSPPTTSNCVETDPRKRLLHVVNVIIVIVVIAHIEYGLSCFSLLCLR